MKVNSYLAKNDYAESVIDDIFYFYNKAKADNKYNEMN
jgi:hypothetical protein